MEERLVDGHGQPGNRKNMKKQFKPKPNSLWLVVYECRYNVIMVSPLGDGFFAPGQEPCWHFRDVQDWVKEIKQPAKARPKSERVTYEGEIKPIKRPRIQYAPGPRPSLYP